MRFTVVFFVMLLFPFMANAETLESAVRDAIQNHPQAEQALARIDAAKAERASERSGYFPEISVNATGGRIFGDNSTSRASVVTRGEAYSYLWEGSASLTQPLFDGFETSHRVAAADAARKSADMSLLDVQEQLAFRTVQAFLNVAQAKTTLAMLKAQEAKMTDYLERIMAMVDEGAADDSEAQQAYDLVVILQGFVIDTQGQLRRAEFEFSELTGNRPDDDMERPRLDLALLSMPFKAAVKQAQRDHPLLQSLAFTAQSAALDIDAERAQFFPGLDGELSYLESDKDEELGGEVTDARAVLRLNWNFETGGGAFARVKQRRFEYEEALAQEREILRQIERDISIAYAEYETAGERLENQAQRVVLASDLHETFEAQFEGGVVRLLQLMQADNQLFNTELEKIALQYRLLNAGYAILASTGRLQDTLLGGASFQQAQR